MGLFGSREELCDVCHSGIPKGDKIKLSDGSICRDCWCNSGITAMLWNIKKLTLEEVSKGVHDQTNKVNQFESDFKESGLANPDINADGIKLRSDTRKWYYMSDVYNEIEIRSFDDVENAWIESIQSGQLQKDSSGSLSRAILGGVIAGPAGAIIGASTNSDKTSVNLANQYTVNIKLHGIEEAQSILMSNKYNAEIVCNAFVGTTAKKTGANDQEYSVADEIRGFKTLLDDGIIDENEFIEMKRSVLDKLKS